DGGARVLGEGHRRGRVPDDRVRPPRLDPLGLGDRALDLVGDEMEAARARLESQLSLEPGQPDSRRTIAATEATTIAAPATIVPVTCSDRMAQPRKIAITGFTYA